MSSLGGGLSDSLSDQLPLINMAVLEECGCRCHCAEHLSLGASTEGFCQFKCAGDVVCD